MSARKKRWDMRPQPSAQQLAPLRDYPPLVAALLYQRGLRSHDQIQAFLSPNTRESIHDPFLLKDMDVAADRVAAAIQNGEQIAVYGDFDADGVTAVALLMQAITAMGGDIQPYIPNRLREGYGLNNVAAEQLAAGGVSLLITVDCGVSNVAEVAHARAHGLDVIVTDHHTPPAELPQANALINPKQPDDEYPFKQLVGVGIAYKLVQALVRRGFRGDLRSRDLLDLVALGTVADMGPLNGENRVLVKVGLEALNETKRPGIRALIDVAGLAQGNVQASDIGFMLGPRLNAAGRLDDAVLAYKLLLAEDYPTARQLADELNIANRKRQELSRDVQQAASEEIRALGKDQQRIIVHYGEAFPAGVVGLVAAKLVDEFSRPVLLLERGEEFSRGSARSVPGFSIIEALTTCEDVFVRYGGHSAAAGFTIATERLPELEERLLAYAETHLHDDMLAPVLEIDVEAPLSAVTKELYSQFEKIEPFGQGNPLPVLMSKRVRVISAQAKSAGQHLKMRLDDGNGGPVYEAMAWRLGHLAEYFRTPRFIDIAYTVEMNQWMGNTTLQLNIKDFRRA